MYVHGAWFSNHKGNGMNFTCMDAIIAKNNPVLYASGEESANQVKLRAVRLGAEKSEQLNFVSSTNAGDIAATIRSANYNLVIIDSIQTLSLDEIRNTSYWEEAMASGGTLEAPEKAEVSKIND